MTEEISHQQFQRLNAADEHWFIFSRPVLGDDIDVKKLSEYQWCVVNCEDDWHTMPRRGENIVLFFVRDICDAIAFRVRHADLEYLCRLPIKTFLEAEVG